MSSPSTPPAPPPPRPDAPAAKAIFNAEDSPVAAAAKATASRNSLKASYLTSPAGVQL